MTHPSDVSSHTVRETRNSANDGSPAREFKQKIWEEYVKPLIDYRVYFRQRSKLLADNDHLPDLASTEWRLPGWKSPLLFALQGTLVVSIAIGVISGVFSLFVKERPTTVFRVERTKDGAKVIPVSVPEGSAWSTKRKLIEQNLATIQSELDTIRHSAADQKFFPPVPYSESGNPTVFMLSVALRLTPVSRQEAENAYKNEVAALQQQLLMARLSPYIEQATEKLQQILLPTAFVIAAYIFLSLVRKKPSSNGRTKEAHIAYLYLVSARLFWATFAFAVLTNSRKLLGQYFPEQFEAIVSDLDQTLRSIDHPRFWNTPIGQTIYEGLSLILVIWALVLLWRASVQLKTYLGVVQTHKNVRPSSMTRKIFGNLLLAQGAAGVVTFLGSVLILEAYAWGRLGLERFSR